MKKLFLILGLLLAGLYSGTAESDFVKGLDMTGQSTVTASQLNQLVDSGTIATNKGLIMRRTTRPPITTDPRYTNFVWLDISGGVPGTLKQYLGNGSTDTDTNWVGATIGLAAITSAMLAPNAVIAGKVDVNAINSTNIANNAILNQHIAAAQIAGSQLQNLTVGRPQLALGSVGPTTLTNDAVGTAAILDGNVTTAKIADGGVTSDKIGAKQVFNVHLTTSSVANTNLMAGAVDTAALGSAAVTTNKISINGASPYQVLRVDPTASYLGYSTPIFTLSATISAGTFPAGAVVYTNAHGLGGVPILLVCTMTNKIAELGYAIGDEVQLTHTDDGVTRNIDISADAVNVYYSQSLPPVISRKTDGGRAGIAILDWGIKIRAFK